MSNLSLTSREWRAIRIAVLNRDGWICAYCNRDLTLVAKGQAQTDHIHPRNHGGTDEMHNLVAACGECNGRKSDKILTRLDWYNPHWLPTMTGVKVLVDDEDVK